MKKSRKLFSSILTFIMLILLSGTAIATSNSDIGVYLDGHALSFDVPPQIIDGRTMVPLRVIFESMGAKVDWDGNTQTITAVKDSILIKMTIGQYDIQLNGNSKKMDVLPIIVDGRTLVPVRFVAQSFGASVDWDSVNRDVIISTNSGGAFNYSSVPVYTGEAYAVVNDNKPFFNDNDYTTVAFENYSDLDSLGRCGIAYANICKELMPVEERGEIGSVKPSGWHTIKYDCVDGKYLYNRCHLIGYQLAGENANEKNLITGTRYLNVVGMLPFENKVDDYVEKTLNHVLYRATPVYNGNNLLADGVLLEASSVEDKGKGLQFCVFCYNVQPGIVIDYATGDSYAGDNSPAYSGGLVITPGEEPVVQTNGNYVGNKNTKKFHKADCSSVSSMKAQNKVYMNTRDEAISSGYEPCEKCKP